MCQGAAIAKIQQEPGKGLELAPAPPLAAEQKQGNRGAGKEDGRDQSLGQRGKGKRRPHHIEAGGTARLHAGEEAIECEQEQETEQRLGDSETGKEKGSDGSEYGEGGIEAGAASPGASRPQPCEPRTTEQGQRVGQVGGKDILAEDAVEAASIQ